VSQALPLAAAQSFGQAAVQFIGDIQGSGQTTLTFGFTVAFAFSFLDFVGINELNQSVSTSVASWSGNSVVVNYKNGSPGSSQGIGIGVVAFGYG
jgi:hypothetical protein